MIERATAELCLMGGDDESEGEQCGSSETGSELSWCAVLLRWR
jgi:hypothetical protein